MRPGRRKLLVFLGTGLLLAAVLAILFSWPLALFASLFVVAASLALELWTYRVGVFLAVWLAGVVFVGVVLGGIDGVSLGLVGAAVWFGTLAVGLWLALASPLDRFLVEISPPNRSR